MNVGGKTVDVGVTVGGIRVEPCSASSSLSWSFASAMGLKSENSLSPSSSPTSGIEVLWALSILSLLTMQ
jgi:hypothetical protein